MTDQTTPETKEPVIKVAGVYFYKSFVEELVEHLTLKAAMASSGLDSVSVADRFAFSVLQNKGYFPEENND